MPGTPKPTSFRWMEMVIEPTISHVCEGLNSHYFHMIGDGHQPNSRGLYTHEIRIPSLKVG